MRFLLSVFILTICAGGYAQGDEVYDTAKRQDPLSTDFITLNRSFTFSVPVDSGMLYLQQYNNVKKKNVAIQDLGDVATPYINLMFQPIASIGLVTGFNPYGENYFYNRNAKFYRAKLPYTYFYYSQGKAGQSGRGFINFDATHTQNIGERFNVGLNYHSTTNEGFYLRNTTAMRNIQLTDYYRSKNQRYLASMIITWNKTIFSENGGIKQSGLVDSLFRNATSNLRFVPIELPSARNISRYRDYQLSQTYWIKGKYSADTPRQFTPQIGISYSVNMQKQANYYTDNTVDFNSNIYDSTYIFNGRYSADSMGFTTFGNSFEVFTPLRENGVSFSTGARYEKLNFYQQANKFNYHRNISHNASIFGQLNFSLLKVFKSELKGNFFISGYNQADHLLYWKNETHLFKAKAYKVGIDVLSSATQPTYQQQVMVSNHYVWENNFKKQINQSVGFGISKMSKKPGIYNQYYYTKPEESFKVKLNYTLLSNYIYYGYDARPAQLETSENVLQLYARKHFSLKKFQINQELVYQVFSGGLRSKILLPNVLSKTSIYFQTLAFKKATFLQIGIDVNYTTDYQAKFYNPATRNFQLSNSRVGNYPYLDFFINAEIKTAKIFFKYDHFNQDLMSTTLFPNYFYASPFQPSALRRFRLGFSWKFYY